MKARVIKTGEIIDVVPKINPNAVSASDILYSSDYRTYKGWELDFINDMETKEIKIIPPKGYEIDKENSTLECIKFKKKSLTYEDIARELFVGKGYYYIDFSGDILPDRHCKNEDLMCGNLATSEKQLEKLLAINKLMNVAKYLNGDWKPDWNDDCEHKYYFYEHGNTINIGNTVYLRVIAVYFRTAELAQQAIDILGTYTIRLALSTDW